MLADDLVLKFASRNKERGNFYPTPDSYLLGAYQNLLNKEGHILQSLTGDMRTEFLRVLKEAAAARYIAQNMDMEDRFQECLSRLTLALEAESEH